jgi:hypothetical protein
MERTITDGTYNQRHVYPEYNDCPGRGRIKAHDRFVPFKSNKHQAHTPTAYIIAYIKKLQTDKKYSQIPSPKNLHQGRLQTIGP